MAERPESLQNRVANGVLTQIRNNARDYPNLWAKIPVTIERGVGSSSEGLPQPIVLVSSNGQIEEQSARDNENHRSHMSLMILMMTKDTATPEAAICDLLTDVWRAIVSNRQLRDIDGDTPILESGRIILGKSETFASLDSPGVGVATLELTAEFTRNASTP